MFSKLFITKNNILVYIIYYNSDEINVTDLFSYLSYEERAKANNYKFIQDKIRFSLTRKLLRLSLSNLLNIDQSKIEFEFTKFGKPILGHPIGNNLKFNISHSGNVICLAFNLEFEIGIDVEKTISDINYKELAENYFTSREVKYVYSADNIDAQIKNFYFIWTRKEAYLKSLGSGLVENLNNIEVLSDTIKKIEPMKVQTTDLCKLKTFTELPSYLVSVAYFGQEKEINLEILNYSNHY